MTTHPCLYVEPVIGTDMFRLRDLAADTVAVIAAPDVLPELQRRKRDEPATRIYASRAVRAAYHETR